MSTYNHMDVPYLLGLVSVKLDKEGPEMSPHKGPRSLGPTGVRWQGIGSCLTRWSRNRHRTVAEIKDSTGELIAYTVIHIGVELYFSWENFADCIVIKAEDVSGRLVRWEPDGATEIILPIVLTELT